MADVYLPPIAACKAGRRTGLDVAVCPARGMQRRQLACQDTQRLHRCSRDSLTESQPAQATQAFGTRRCVCTHRRHARMPTVQAAVTRSAAAVSVPGPAHVRLAATAVRHANRPTPKLGATVHLHHQHHVCNCVPQRGSPTLEEETAEALSKRREQGCACMTVMNSYATCFANSSSDSPRSSTMHCTHREISSAWALRLQLALHHARSSRTELFCRHIPRSTHDWAGACKRKMPQQAARAPCYTTSSAGEDETASGAAHTRRDNSL